MCACRQAAPTRHAFTLLELLVVLTIMLAAFGMIAGTFAKRNLRLTSVQMAANEMAETFRKARARAMETKSCYSVVFNIQNDPASSGRVLNNRTGGHWYRILGPTTNDMGMFLVDPGIQSSGPYTLYAFQESLKARWYDDAHVLPAKKVRIVALSDMDWGDYTKVNTAWTGRQKSPTVSFPRPWFGWWDSSSKRLYPWGGYDPAIMASGFYFWGSAAPAWAARDSEPINSATGLPPGCANAQDRKLDAFTGSNTYMVYNTKTPDIVGGDLLYAKGSPRPLVNADWMDAALVFLGNGMVVSNAWMPARRYGTFRDSSWTSGSWKSGVAERCNQFSIDEATHFSAASGGYFITLGPDALDDNDQFQSAKDAVDAMMPLYRVFVSSFGEVRVIAVSRTSKYGTMSAFPTSESWWRTGNNTVTYFGESRYNTAATKYYDNVTGNGVYAGQPITDFIDADMLTNRSVWMK